MDGSKENRQGTPLDSFPLGMPPQQRLDTPSNKKFNTPTRNSTRHSTTNSTRYSTRKPRHCQSGMAFSGRFSHGGGFSCLHLVTTEPKIATRTSYTNQTPYSATNSTPSFPAAKQRLPSPPPAKKNAILFQGGDSRHARLVKLWRKRRDR